MITLRKENVVKQVETEEKARALQAKGFLRDGARKEAASDDAAELSALQEELEDAKELLEAEQKKNAALQAELDGTKEQLETALKQNRDAAVEQVEEAAGTRQSSAKKK